MANPRRAFEEALAKTGDTDRMATVNLSRVKSGLKDLIKDAQSYARTVGEDNVHHMVGDLLDRLSECADAAGFRSEGSKMRRLVNELHEKTWTYPK